ncbi:MAG: hypothetical protein UX30_C0007G0125 [Candidatus Saccharibacteria bacterium GW2011_GWA2_46_10]|nr:MAG: hypothetical protein UX30_C0007G0125 [Candidatus Saccharibacteria bacterium GW2011_GWA2_46_10]OGL35873.1 MAG: hypothetical protein A3F05_00855 [Candidatus Saccharibacteria bacterium RIFCSPHIGHO2_12_FULL_47_17]
MHKNTSVVEINGQKYDMATGKIIGAVKNRANRLKAKTPFISMDGIVRLPVMAKVRPASRNRHPRRVVHNVHRQTQRSKTLMRRIVNKAHSKVKVGKNPIKKALVGRNPVREAHAKLTPQHHRVKHFGILTTRSGRIKDTEITSSASKRSKALALASPIPSVAASPSHQRLERLLDYALARADAHKQSRRKRSRGPAKLLHILPKWLTVLLIVLTLGSLAGFVAWQKIPAISMKVAASKAHVDSAIPNLPGYTVAAPAQEKDGIVTIELKAIADPANTVTVTKKAISTAESTNLSEKSCPNDNQIQTFSQDGATSFICGQTNKAVGVVGGVMTEIQANGDQSITGSASSLFSGQ